MAEWNDMCDRFEAAKKKNEAFVQQCEVTQAALRARCGLDPR